jgi:putative ABC transport system permease protein
MIKNFLKTAWRLLLRNKAFSFINIVGLALSMAVCLLIIIVIKDANSYDTFHYESNRIYRINTEVLRKGGGTERFASSPYVVGATLADQFSGIDTWTMFYTGFQKDLIIGDNKYNTVLRFTNDDFFNLFNFTFDKGNPANALKNPNTMVLTKELSEKLFPGVNPLGKTIEVSEIGPFTITGVLNKFPGKTHFEFEALASFATVPALERDSLVQPVIINWKNYYNNFTYIRLKPGVQHSQVENVLATIQESNYKGLALESRDAGYRFLLQPLNNITPAPMISNDMGKGLPAGALRISSILALVIIMSAAFNYTNLTIAKSIGRTKEIAMRKVVGSRRKHVFWQITVESIVTSLLSLVIAFGMLQLLVPRLKSFGIEEINEINFGTDPSLLLFFIGFAILLGFVAGVFPATVLSRIHPLALMRKLHNVKIFRYLGMRKAMLIIQFIVSFIFISLVIVVHKQVEYAVSVNFGTQQSHIFNISLGSIDYNKAVAGFSSVPGVEQISATSSLMGTYSDETDEVRITKDREATQVREYFVDESYIPNLGLNLVSGDNFPRNISQKQERFVVVNEKFVEHFKLGTAHDAVGKTIFVGDSTELVIKGVLKDFLFKPADYALEPMMLRYDPRKWYILNVSIASAGAVKTVAQLESVWKDLDRFSEFDGQFYRDDIEESFSMMRNAIWIVAFFGTLGTIIACLGMLGITIFTIQSRTKEVSIRKVIGASPAALMKLLTKTYVQVMIVAILLAVPIIVLVSNALLQSSQHHIDLSPVLFIPGVAIVLGLSLATIGFQTLRAIFMNPVNGLREE